MLALSVSIAGCKHDPKQIPIEKDSAAPSAVPSDSSPPVEKEYRFSVRAPHVGDRKRASFHLRRKMQYTAPWKADSESDETFDWEIETLALDGEQVTRVKLASLGTTRSRTLGHGGPPAVAGHSYVVTIVDGNPTGYQREDGITVGKEEIAQLRSLARQSNLARTLSRQLSVHPRKPGDRLDDLRPIWENAFGGAGIHYDKLDVVFAGPEVVDGKTLAAFQLDETRVDSGSESGTVTVRELGVIHQAFDDAEIGDTDVSETIEISGKYTATGTGSFVSKTVRP